MKYLILLLFFVSSVCKAAFFIPNGYITAPKFGTVTDASTLDQGGASGKLEIKAGGVNTTQLANQAVTSAKLVGRSTFTFTATIAAVTSGYQYTNNGFTFTSTYTTLGSTTLYFQGTGTPAASGTLTCVTASGCVSNITYSAFTNGSPYAIAGGIAVSPSSGYFTGSSTTAAAITNMSVTLTPTGRPVMVCVTPDGTTNSSYISVYASPATSSVVSTTIVKNGTTLNSVISSANVSSSGIVDANSGPFCFIDILSGSSATTYSLKYIVSGSGSPSYTMAYMILTAFEL